MSTDIRATYRVQLHAGFTLDDAAAQAGYLAKLGISHLYCSPYLAAAPGSKHGYDVVDPRHVNPELGGEEAHQRLSAALRKAGLGQVLDIVPNHMAIGTSANPWWWSVLENGPASRYAVFFDVDWDPPEARHSNQVLVPVLGDHYGRVLEAGEIQVAREGADFTVRYFDNRYPVDPRSLSSLAASAAERSGSPELAFLAGALDRLPVVDARTEPAAAEERWRDQRVLRGYLERLEAEQPALGEALDAVVADLNADFDALDVFLNLQNYRLAFWQMASRELGYRRFFDINTLIGLRMQDANVFLDTHARILDWVERGVVDGLRIDHPDGLRDPEGYFLRLRESAPNATIVIEKIVEPGEHIPREWPVQGTTGYDFMHRAGAVLVDPSAEPAFSAFYERFTGRSADFDALVIEKKLQVIADVLGSDTNRLTELLIRVSEKQRRYRDYPRFTLRRALSLVAAFMPVYRTYVRAEEGVVRPSDVEHVEHAVARANAYDPETDPALLDFLADLLLLRLPSLGADEQDFVMRFQQFTGPAMAKGVEDTAFYNYYRLVSLNEVGGTPGHFGMRPAEFHAACVETQRAWPRSLLASSTHDTKRSEDVRARIHALSEIPDEWFAAVERWAAMNRPKKTGGAPDANDEYLIYQTLVGAWPISEERLLQYLEKAARESKAHSTWTKPDAAYEAGLASFARALLADGAFIADLERFLERVIPAGQRNSLAQTLLKLTTPGVPDVYQGTELWDFSLVDPDNRRPVDYALRARLLDELEGMPVEQITARMDEGLPKLWLIRQALRLRAVHPEWFGEAAAYQPLEVSSEAALAYQRGENVAAVLPRLTLRYAGQAGETRVALPPGRWRNLLTSEMVDGGSRTLAELTARFPVALLVRADEP